MPRSFKAPASPVSVAVPTVWASRTPWSSTDTTLGSEETYVTRSFEVVVPAPTLARAVGSPWVFPRLVAAIVLGKGVLPPPATITPGILLAALAIHLPLSIAYACLIAFVLHRWGLLVGIVGGAALGLALYMINFGTTFAIFPWFAPMKSGISLWAHVAFGAVAGGTYELLEVERFVPEDARK